jgi:5-methylthioadenosine/S-adenosylhomocysteine deaminase
MENIMINNGFIVTLNPWNEIIPNGALVIEDNRILDVGKSVDISRRYSADIKIDAAGQAVIPGLINSHTHLCETLMKGLGDDRTLWDWSREIYGAASLLSEEDLYHGVLNGCIEMIRSGTTCCIDYERYGDAAIRSYKSSGIRGVLARVFMDAIPDIYSEAQRRVLEHSLESNEEILRDLQRLIEQHHNSVRGRIRIMPAPDMTYVSLEDTMKDARELAYKYKTGFTTHLNETKSEVDYCLAKHGVQEIEYAYNLGLLGRDTIAAHCVWASNKEIDIMVETGTTCAHNPESNMYLASGIAPIPEMLRKGINVSLATDGPASNNNLDMFEAMRFAALLHKVHKLDPIAIKAMDVLKMATINGAKAINCEDKLGSLEKGKLADVILVNLKRPNTTPTHDVVSSLVYCATGDNVDTVIIDGKILLRTGKFVELDDAAIVEKTQKIAERIGAR